MPTASNTNAPNINAPAADRDGGALPQLFSFRRCPYAIRARLALAAAGQAYAPIEVMLRDKPAALLAASPKGTVPVLVLPSGQVIDESLDIMLWALQRHDPQAWLQPTHGGLQAMLALVHDLDRHFKPLLDRCKYPQRHPEHALQDSRQLALQWLQRLELALASGPWLFGQRLALADAAVFPFVRQFAAIDPPWWNAQLLPRLQAWRQRWLALPLFEQIMRKGAQPGG